VFLIKCSKYRNIFHWDTLYFLQQQQQNAKDTISIACGCGHQRKRRFGVKRIRIFMTLTLYGGMRFCLDILSIWAAKSPCNNSRRFCGMKTFLHSTLTEFLSASTECTQDLRITLLLLLLLFADSV
jgi:hypothetical protein